ncbi:MAG: twin-arginine translocase subunit TatC [Gemmatimonadota bacterium]
MTSDPREMPFLDHLEELRERLIWVLVALALASIAGFFVVVELNVIGLLERPIRDLMPGEQLLFTDPTTPIMVTFKLAFVVGIILALPYIAYHVWSFFSPALHDHERRYVVPALWVAFLLFLAGIAMAYFLVLPLGLQFLLTFQAESLEPIITIDHYLRFATRLILAFGIIFEMPVVLVLLSLLGITTPEGLRHYRRHAYVGLAALSAILTPADLGTMAMMMGPLVLLYEASIWLVKLVVRERKDPASAGPGGA